LLRRAGWPRRSNSGRQSRHEQESDGQGIWFDGPLSNRHAFSVGKSLTAYAWPRRGRGQSKAGEVDQYQHSEDGVRVTAVTARNVRFWPRGQFPSVPRWQHPLNLGKPTGTGANSSRKSADGSGAIRRSEGTREPTRLPLVGAQQFLLQRPQTGLDVGGFLMEMRRFTPEGRGQAEDGLTLHCTSANDAENELLLNLDNRFWS
jgi:hypothetical protein